MSKRPRGLLDDGTVLLDALDRYIAAATLDELLWVLGRFTAALSYRVGSRAPFVLAASGGMRQAIEASYGIAHKPSPLSLRTPADTPVPPAPVRP